MKNLGFHQEMCWQLRFCNKIVLWSPEHPRTRPPSHAHTQHTRTPTHTKQNTDRQTGAHMDTQTHTQLGQEAGIGNTHKQSYRATATEPPNQMPDARCQMNRLTDTSQTDSHTGTQTQKHTHTHTHSHRATQPDKHTQAHIDTQLRTQNLMLTGQPESTSHTDGQPRRRSHNQRARM